MHNHPPDRATASTFRYLMSLCFSVVLEPFHVSTRHACRESLKKRRARANGEVPLVRQHQSAVAMWVCPAYVHSAISESLSKVELCNEREAVNVGQSNCQGCFQKRTQEFWFIGLSSVWVCTGLIALYMIPWQTVVPLKIGLWIICTTIHVPRGGIFNVSFSSQLIHEQF